MLTKDWVWSASDGFRLPDDMASGAPSFVLFFGSRQILGDGAAYTALREAFPAAHLLGCSTGGQFNRLAIEDDQVFALAASFETAHCKLASVDIEEAGSSHASGVAVGAALAADDLRGILVLSDGLGVNGSELVAGIISAVTAEVIVSGGLAGDGAAFETTLVSADCLPRSGLVAALGLYGASLDIGSGSAGGWDPFGPRRVITRSAGNVLYELDGEPALDLYERYLGEDEFKALPGSALLFPLRINDPRASGRDVVRTVLAVDHTTRSMTFAGDLPQGWTAELMRGHFDRLALGAAEAARQASQFERESEGFAVLVSCIGRRLLMGQRAADEIDAAASEISGQHKLIGFYSYGEISPHAHSGFCQLHNQTMTVMTVQERLA